MRSPGQASEKFVCLIKHHAMKTRIREGGVGAVECYDFITTSLDGGG